MQPVVTSPSTHEKLSTKLTIPKHPTIPSKPTISQVQPTIKQPSTKPFSGQFSPDILPF
jgi:hypothetical protein